MRHCRRIGAGMRASEPTLPLAPPSSFPLACSRRSDSGERCEVKRIAKKIKVPFYFLSLSLLRTAFHYLNAWNRLPSLPDPVPKIITWLLPVLADLFPYLSDLGAQVLHFYSFECLNWKRKQKKIVMHLIILNSKPNRRFNWYLPEDDNPCTVDAPFFLQERCLFRPRLSILIFSADFRLELFLYCS